MAERVVDELEAVDVHEQHAQPLPRAVGLGHRHLQPVVEEQAVGQAGQGIVIGQGAHPLVAALPVGDVEGHAQGGAASPELDEAAREVQPALLPALGEDLELVATGHLIAPLAGEAALLHEAAKVGVHEVGEAQAQELVGGVAGEGGRRGVDEAELAALIDEDGAGSGFGQGPEACLALAEGVARPHPLERARHVARDEGEHVQIGLGESHSFVIALHREHAEGLVAPQERHPQPIDGGGALKLGVATGHHAREDGRRREERLGRAQDVIGEGLARRPRGRRLVEGVDEVGERDAPRGLVAQGDVEVPGVQELAHDLVDGAVEGGNVEAGGGDLGDGVQGLLQALRPA